MKQGPVRDTLGAALLVTSGAAPLFLVNAFRYIDVDENSYGAIFWVMLIYVLFCLSKLNDRFPYLENIVVDRFPGELLFVTIVGLGTGSLSMIYALLPIPFWLNLGLGSILALGAWMILVIKQL